mmetsp:Transcript_8514/g.19731  ORF Transcript_8514/g.19731 Transcript_8514/m.19731 type:complete len:385 (-) Transcript_8514:713-1867(-)
MQRDFFGCGGLAAWALAHVYDAEGRTSEGISWLAGYDGVQLYEACGYLFFNARIAGYGARFALDREGAGRVRTPLRVYDNSFDPILQYSGYAQRQPWQSPQRRSPGKRTTRMVQSVRLGSQALLQRIFGSQGQESASELPAPQENVEGELKKEDTTRSTIEDVLTWLPPTPQVLTEATLLLLRLTLVGAIGGDDSRWSALQNSWLCLLDENSNDPNSNSNSQIPPRSMLGAYLLCDPDDLPSGPGSFAEVGRGMRLLGMLLGLADAQSDDTELNKGKWKEVVDMLSFAAGRGSGTFNLWDLDSRPLFEHAVCYAACMSEDYESLSVARSICSMGVVLRPNSPEEWWRYSSVLEKLGDDVAAEDARAASISLGLGEGGHRPESLA